MGEDGLSGKRDGEWGSVIRDIAKVSKKFPSFFKKMKKDLTYLMTWKLLKVKTFFKPDLKDSFDLKETI